jgi:tetratricopeptide (TPR) repeat protein
LWLSYNKPAEVVVMRLLPKPLVLALVPLTCALAISAQQPSGRPEEPLPKRKKSPKTKTAPAPLTVTLTILTDPPECDVYINGEKRGTTNTEGKAQLSKLPLGHYSIEVRKQGFNPALRGFEAGTDSPTLVFKLTPRLDDALNQFNSLLEAGKLIGPESPNALELLNDLSSKFPDRPELGRMRTALVEKLLDTLRPVINRTLFNWREVMREELAQAEETAVRAASLKKDDKRAQAQSAYLRAMLALRDWQTSAQPATGSDDAVGRGLKVKSDEGATGGLATARAELESALHLEDSWVAAQYQLGVVFLISGDVSAAEAALIKATQLEPKWALTHAGLGAAYMAGRNYREAIAEYQKAIALDPKYAAAYAGLGLARAARGDTNGAIKDVQRAMELDPISALPHLNLGIILSRSKKEKDLVRAEEELRKAIQMNPNNVEFNNRTAELLLAELQNRRQKRK